mgnify:CR=1 FL=1
MKIETQLDQIVSNLSRHKTIWAEAPISQRLPYLQGCIAATEQVAPAWAEAACRAKGIDPTAPLAGEEWLMGPAATLSHLQAWVRSLQAGGQPPPTNLRQWQNQTIARVFPATPLDRFLWPGYSGEVWIEPGQPATQSRVYRQASPPGQVALVLGAGNVSSIAPLDALYKLLAENAVVLLKLNPVNDYMGPFLETALAPFIQAGFLAIVDGGAEVGAYLCQHPQVDTIHITGSHHTHDAIVWGSDPAEQTRRRTSQQPQIHKPITSELGCVTPVLVVPGPWSEADLAYQARQVAGMVVHNASFNCAAAKVVVTARGWPQRQSFLAKLRQELAATPARQPYYPGALERYQEFRNRYPQAEVLGKATVPWTLIPDVTPTEGEYALTQEAFCGVLAEVNLEATTAAEFLPQAVEFVNHKVWGNLSCVILIHPKTQKHLATELHQAIADLRYGAIAVNVWSAVVYSIPACTWGAFSGNPLEDVRSGRGVVHNTYLFDHPQKSVVYAPFRIVPMPLWFPRHPKLLALGKSFTRVMAKPSLDRIMQLLLQSLFG